VKKILIVEDHKDSCLWIAAVLRQCGFQAIEAGDASVAVRMARLEIPDLILLDLHLPAGGGQFVMESLRLQEETAKIPIVIMTGDPDVDQADMKLRGASEVFCKPMDVHAFLSTIRRTLEDEATTLIEMRNPALDRAGEPAAAGELLPS
jgi:DNA-binding response OmpR family regulator